MKQVTAPPITVYNGLPVALKIGHDDLGVFPFVIPASPGRVQFPFAQIGDSTNQVMRDAFVSKTPGYTTPQEDRWKPVNGSFPEGKFADCTSSGALNVLVDGQAAVVYGPGTVELHATVGDTWYLTFRNHYSKSDAKHPDQTAYNISVTPQPINV